MDVRESGKLRIDRLIQQEGSDAAFLGGDVAKKEDRERAVSTALDQFDGLDILHNSAGADLTGQDP
jgi:NAD(P)-dependent dehydrogenase (short-subunit alcohol dehydrogenase family)